MSKNYFRVENGLQRKADVTRDDLQRRFSAQHSVAMLQQCCNHSKQYRSNAVMLCCAKKRCCESSRVRCKRGTLGGTQYRNTVTKNGKYRNTASKIVQIPIPHILITFIMFIIGSAYLWLLPSSAFNYLRHLTFNFTRRFSILETQHLNLFLLR